MVFLPKPIAFQVSSATEVLAFAIAVLVANVSV